MIAPWQTFRRLWVFLRPYTGQLAFVLIISLAATSLSLVQPYISKLLFDQALMKRDLQALVLIAGLMFVAIVAGFALNILSSYRYVRVSAAMLFDMRLALFRHLQTLSPRFYAGYRLGDLMSRLNNDVGEVQRVTADTLLSVLSNVVFPDRQRGHDVMDELAVVPCQRGVCACLCVDVSTVSAPIDGINQAIAGAQCRSGQSVRGFDSGHAGGGFAQCRRA